MQRKRSTSNMQIQAPQLPKQLPPATPAPDSLDNQASYSQITLLDCDFSGQVADDVLFDQVACARVRFNQAQINLAQVLDVRFDTCDFAEATWKKAHMRRVELVGCRIVGMQCSDSSFEDLRVLKCNGELARFWSSNFKAARFEQCVLREASFEESNLAGVVFRNCDLTKADFRGAKLEGADFCGSTIAGMQVGIKEIHGAIIDPAQVIHLADLLGVVVKADDAAPL